MRKPKRRTSINSWEPLLSYWWKKIEKRKPSVRSRVHTYYLFLDGYVSCNKFHSLFTLHDVICRAGNNKIKAKLKLSFHTPWGIWWRGGIANLILYGPCIILQCICSTTKYTKFFLWLSLFITFISSTCFGPHRSIIRSVLQAVFADLVYGNTHTTRYV